MNPATADANVPTTAPITAALTRKTAREVAWWTAAMMGLSVILKLAIVGGQARLIPPPAMNKLDRSPRVNAPIQSASQGRSVREHTQPL